MLDVFFLGYVHFFAVLLPALAVALVTMGATQASLSPTETRVAVLVPAILLGAWYAIANHMSQTNVFNVPATLAEPPIVLAFLFGGAFTLWALARLTAIGRAVTDRLDLGLLAAFQIPRVMGALFLLGWAAGVIPWQFALLAGLGDIWAGIAGYQAWQAVRRNAPDARRKLVQANVIGIGDFVVAVFMGITTSEGFAHLWAHEAPNIINLHPLALFPGFFVPIFLAFHLILISRLRHSSAIPAAA
ncbi:MULTISPECIES: hypothetical protein [unclassified Roseovarius]|uniref:hypothetical protein n=1 Tax=unclassified Roseovarius TaxID=2614913 RepID=UPI00273E79CD|nr:MULTISPECIES: hypothetical protein [unclassified Roseovarius]